MAFAAPDRGLPPPTPRGNYEAAAADSLPPPTPGATTRRRPPPPGRPFGAVWGDSATTYARGDYAAVRQQRRARTSRPGTRWRQKDPRRRLPVAGELRGGRNSFGRRRRIG